MDERNIVFLYSWGRAINGADNRAQAPNRGIRLIVSEKKYKLPTAAEYSTQPDKASAIKGGLHLCRAYLPFCALLYYSVSPHRYVVPCLSAGLPY